MTLSSQTLFLLTILSTLLKLQTIGKYVSREQELDLHLRLSSYQRYQNLDHILGHVLVGRTRLMEFHVFIWLLLF